MTLPFLAIKGFDGFQHYKNRRPPWIKFYATILTDAAMMQLPEAAQAQLFKLWLLASQMGNPLPNNPKFLNGKIGVQGKSYLSDLMRAGFLIPSDTPEAASDVIAGCEHDASKTLGHIDQRIEGQNLLVDYAHDPLTALAVWCNSAITEKWGEQLHPLRRAQCSDLARSVIGVEPAVVRDSIYDQCRRSNNEKPPTHPNYFRKGVALAWEREGARRAVASSGEQPPAIRVAGQPSRPPSKSDRVTAELTEFVSHGE